MKDLLVQIMPALIAFLGAVVTALLAMAAKWLKAKTDNQALLGIGAVVQNAVVNAVKEQEMKLVSNARSEAGKLATDVAEQAAAGAEKAVMEQLGPKAVKAAQKAFKTDVPGFSKMVKSQVEAAVFDLKLLKKK